MQLVFVAIAIKIIALLIGILYLKRFPLPFRLLVLQVLLALVVESYGFYLGYIKLQNNIWIFNYYLLFEALLLSIISLSFIDNKLIKKLTPPVLTAISGIWFYEILTESIHILANKFFIAYGILLIILNISILFNKTFSQESIFKSPVFWIAVSTIIYFSCVIPYKGMENYLISKFFKLADRLFDILQIANIIRYLFIALSFYLFGTQHKTKMGVSTGSTFPEHD